MNVQHLSLSNERFTPSSYIEAGRAVMGGIDFDPASHYLANQVVKANGYYGTNREGRFVNGFTKKWRGKTWLNAPGGICDQFGQQVHRANSTRKACTETGSCGLPVPHKHEKTGSSAKIWYARLVQQWQAGDVEQAIYLGFTLEILRSAQSLPVEITRPSQLPFCIPRSRIKFFEPREDELFELKSPTHANVIVYLPPLESPGHSDTQHFKEVFSQFGDVRI